MKRFLFPLLAVLSLAFVPVATAAPPPMPDQVEQVALGAYLAPPPSVAQLAPAVVHQAPVLAALDLSGLSGLVTPANIATVLLALLGLIAGAYKLSDRRKLAVAKAIQHAFLTVEDLDSNKLLNLPKVEAGLRAADEWMKANGWRPLAEGEKVRAQLGFTAMNGATVLQARAGAVPPVPSAK